MTKLSVVIITYNEEKNIERCLQSVKEIADEIVVVDSYSQDKTPEICSQYPVNFIQHPFEGHIEQKNRARKQASYPFVLSLDADEAVSERLKQSILEVKQDPQHDGYYFNRLTNYCGKWIRHCGWYPDRKLRLWNRDMGQWTGINPHDRFEMENEASTAFLKGDLLHYSYYSIKGHIDQVNKFSDLGSQALFQKGKKSNLLKICFKPLWKFFKDYILQGGFRDGYYGFVISVISSHATFLKYVKIKELQKNSQSIA